MHGRTTACAARTGLTLGLVLAVGSGLWAAQAGRGPEAARARQILEAAGVKGGLVVHLGCGDGKLTAALRASDRTLVHGLDPDPAHVAAARRHIQSLGLYGKVTVDRLRGARLPYADDLVNLLVASGQEQVARGEVMRVLAPGGVACVRRDGGWVRTVKPRPSSIDEWTHWRHGADGNMVSRDEMIGPPRRVQWVAGPLWQQHHGRAPSITVIVSAGGRVFSIADEAPVAVSGLPGQWRLIARDAFSGVLLWKRPIAPWGSEAWSYWTEGHPARFNHPIHIRKRLVAVGELVYVTLGFHAPVCALDAATGTTVRTYQGTQHTDEFVHHGGVLYLSVNDRAQKPWPGDGAEPAPTRREEPSKKHIWAVEAATGTVLWKSGPFLGNAAKPDRLGSMRHIELTVSDLGVFLVDERHVVCLEPGTGKERWRSPRLLSLERPERPPSRAYLYHGLNEVNLHTMLCYQGVLLVAHPRNQRAWGWRTPMIVQALAPSTGKELWRREALPINCLDPPDVLGARGLVWLPDGKRQALIGLDPATGREQRVLSIKKVLDVGHHHRCYRNKATANYVVVGRRGAELVDLRTGEISLHHWARGGCRYGHLLANGLFYKPPDHCQCYMAFEPRGFYALAPAGRGERRGASDEGSAARLERGPAFGQPLATSHSPLATSADWPTFRHDPMRSSSTRAPVALPLKPVWQAAVGGKLTSPVVAGGRAYCCSPDRHQVHALDAASGRRLWSYRAGGRVDSPPTVHGGAAIFGAADGHVYCLRAADGQLAWRMRVAPSERRVVAFGQVESAWPVSGSVLVAGGVVFCVAGRSSFLDGGIYACALDAATGKLLERKRIHEIQTDTARSGTLPRGALQDILATDGAAVYLRRRRLELSTPLRLAPGERAAEGRLHVVAAGGFLDSQWFHRAYWSLGRVRGNLMAFDGTRTYAVTARNPRLPANFAFYVPAGGRVDRVARGKAGRDPAWLAGVEVRHGGYQLIAVDRGRAAKASKQARRGPAARRAQPAWSQAHFPVCPWAMVVAGDTLFVAGFPDRVKAGDPWATFEGRGGGVLRALAVADGRQLAEHKLDSPPVWHGMAAAGGRLYLTTVGGKVLCMGKGN